MLWGLYAGIVVRRERGDLYYTRDSEIAYCLVKRGLPTVYETHVVPKRGHRLTAARVAVCRGADFVHQAAIRRDGLSCTEGYFLG